MEVVEFPTLCELVEYSELSMVLTAVPHSDHCVVSLLSFGDL